jgi:hypothetical protein
VASHGVPAPLGLRGPKLPPLRSAAGRRGPGGGCAEGARVHGRFPIRAPHPHATRSGHELLRAGARPLRAVAPGHAEADL